MLLNEEFFLMEDNEVALIGIVEARESTFGTLTIVWSFLDLDLLTVDCAFHLLVFPDKVRGIVFDGSISASFQNIKKINNANTKRV